MLKYIGLNAVLVLAYYITGRLGLLLAVPPGYETVFWPASGIALAFVYIYGYRLLPGVFIRAAVLHISGMLARIGGEDMALLLQNASGIGLGAMLQAAVGCYLLYRFIGRQSRLQKLRHIFDFILWGVLFAGLFSATIGTLTLYLTGVLTTATAISSWWTWYAGDVLGGIVFAPVLILALNKRANNRRKLMVGVPMLVMFAVAVMGFGMIRYQDRAVMMEEFLYDARLIASEVEDKFRTYRYQIGSVQNFFRSSEDVSRAEFRMFGQAILRQSPSLLELQWLPRVRRADRPALQSAAQADGLAGYRIVNIDPEQAQDESYPIFYSEPGRGRQCEPREE